MKSTVAAQIRIYRVLLQKPAAIFHTIKIIHLNQFLSSLNMTRIQMFILQYLLCPEASICNYQATVRVLVFSYSATFSRMASSTNPSIFSRPAFGREVRNDPVLKIVGANSQTFYGRATACWETAFHTILEPLRNFYLHFLC